MMKVNENVRKLREKNALSRAAFAGMIGLEEEELAEVEKGKRALSTIAVYTIADIFGVSAGWLMSGEENNGYEAKYDAVLRIHNATDRETVIRILAMNGYDVGQHKAERTKTGKTVDYFVHAKLSEGNAETLR